MRTKDNRRKDGENREDIKNTKKAREIAQSVKPLPYKHDNLHMSPQTHVKLITGYGMCI